MKTKEKIPELPADVLANFTDNQWYCFEARQSVFLACFSSKTISREALIDHAVHVARLAPQILQGYAAPTASDDELRALLTDTVEVSETEDLNLYPNAFDLSTGELFDRLDLPMIRFKAVNLPDGTEQAGRRAAFVAISTHALFEGMDASILSRSQSVSRETKPSKPTRRRWFYEFLFSIVAFFAAPVQIVLANFSVPDRMDMVFHGTAIERDRLRALARAFGVRQRALLYALATFVMNDHGQSFGTSRLRAMLAEFDPDSDKLSNDSYFQFRMVSATLPVIEDFAQFAQDVNVRIKSAEGTRTRATQILLNAMFAAHRRLKAVLPFIYSEKVFRYVMGYHIDLSLLPPVRPTGPLTDSFEEPIHGGTFHPGLNCCVFTPGRGMVTFNFVVREHMIPGVQKLETLVDKLEQHIIEQTATSNE